MLSHKMSTRRSTMEESARTEDNAARNERKDRNDTGFTTWSDKGNLRTDAEKRLFEEKRLDRRG